MIKQQMKKAAPLKKTLSIQEQFSGAQLKIEESRRPSKDEPRASDHAMAARLLSGNLLTKSIKFATTASKLSKLYRLRLKSTVVRSRSQKFLLVWRQLQSLVDVAIVGRTISGHVRASVGAKCAASKTWQNTRHVLDNKKKRHNSALQPNKNRCTVKRLQRSPKKPFLTRRRLIHT